MKVVDVIVLVGYSGMLVFLLSWFRRRMWEHGRWAKTIVVLMSASIIVVCSTTLIKEQPLSLRLMYVSHSLALLSGIATLKLAIQKRN